MTTKQLTITQHRFAESAGACMHAWRKGDLFTAGRHFQDALDAYYSMSGNGPAAQRAHQAMSSLCTVCGVER